MKLNILVNNFSVMSGDSGPGYFIGSKSGHKLKEIKFEFKTI